MNYEEILDRYDLDCQKDELITIKSIRKCELIWKKILFTSTLRITPFTDFWRGKRGWGRRTYERERAK